MLLLILIPIAWLAALATLAALCRIAAQGDGRYASTAPHAQVSIGPKLVLSTPARPSPRRARWGHGAERKSLPSRSRQRRRSAHPVR
jgi:hypothetical protein